jgi:hypothetical protein
MPENNIDIDFDKASELWRKNKISIGNGCFKYVCGAKRKDGGKCCNKPCKHKKRCYLHINQKVQ